MKIGIKPLWWLLCYLGFCWARREMSALHPDMAKVLLGRAKYGRLLGIAEFNPKRIAAVQSTRRAAAEAGPASDVQKPLERRAVS